MARMISLQTAVILVVVLVAAQMVQGQGLSAGQGAGLNSKPAEGRPSRIMDVLSNFRRYARDTSVVDKIRAILETRVETKLTDV